MSTVVARQVGRAKNAVLAFWESKLFIPKIYMDAEWSGTPVDLLAIDRSGVGDIHVALFYNREVFDPGNNNTTCDSDYLQEYIDRLKPVRAHWKYVVCVQDHRPQAGLISAAKELSERMFAEDGIGRVGLYLIDFWPGDDPQVSVITKPERFRARVGAEADAYILQHTPDWELRDTPID